MQNEISAFYNSDSYHNSGVPFLRKLLINRSGTENINANCK